MSDRSRKIATWFLGITEGVIIFLNIEMGFYMNTTSVWAFGFLGMLVMLMILYINFPVWIQNKYKDWIIEDEEFYTEWRDTFRKQQKTILFWFLMGEIGVFLFFVWRTRYFWLNNYAVYYVLATYVIMIAVFAEFVVVRYMFSRLEEYMNRLSDLQQKTINEALEKALEIERESLEKVSRSDQLRMDLITNVSHDLKTPLTSMVGYLELLKKEELNDTSKDYLEIILRRAQKLKEMIESLFSLAKVTSGNVELHKEKLTMNRMIEQIFADMEDKVRDADLEFVRIYTEEDTTMITDNSYLYRICQNLLENALKYAAKGTRVFVKTYISEDDRVGLEITNTAGYRMDFTKEDIVERFARADAARTTEGNGLGLAIVSTYAKALGGQFDIFLDYDQFKAQLLFVREIPEETAEQ